MSLVHMGSHLLIGLGERLFVLNDGVLYDDMRKLMGRANRSKAAKFIIQRILDSPGEGLSTEGRTFFL